MTKRAKQKLISERRIAILSFFLLVAMVLGFAYLRYDVSMHYEEAAEKATVILPSGNQLIVDVVSSEEDRAKGLSGREHLTDSEGMLFLHTYSAQHAYWMKDMVIPIDMIWLQDEEIIHIEENVPIETGEEYTHYRPEKPANRVLEVRAGLSEKQRLHEGDHLDIYLD